MGPHRQRRLYAWAAHRVRARHALVWGLLLSAGCGPVYELSSRALYPPASLAEPPAATPPGAVRLVLEVAGGEVHALYLPPPESPRPAPAVIFAHGNAERVEDWAERLAPYRAMGLGVLLPEYRGYGGAAGEPSEAAIVEDFVRFHDRLADRPEVDARRIVFHGRSLGGGVVGALTRRRAPAALILESTFTNVPDVASRYFAPAALIRDRYDTRDVLERADMPTLLVHGVRDAVVPFAHAVELDRVAWDSQLLALEAGHNDVPHGPAYWRAIRTLLERAGVVTALRAPAR